MIVDSRNEFASAAAIALNVGNAIAPNTHVIDRGASPELVDLGVGAKQMFLVLAVTTSFVGATATINFDLLSDSVPALTTSPTTHWSSGAIGVATWVAGYRKIIPLPIEETYERYLGLWMTVGTANVTAGAIDAFLTDQPDAYRALPDGNN